MAVAEAIGAEDVEVVVVVEGDADNEYRITRNKIHAAVNGFWKYNYRFMNAKRNKGIEYGEV